MTVSEFKAQFSKVVEQGEKIAVTYGRKKEIVGYFVPVISKPGKRQLGILEGIATFTFADDFKMTEEEFLGL